MKMNCLSTLGLMGAFLLVLPVSGQLVAPEPQPVVGARMPALSPDGKQLAFTYRGDIWIAAATGGRATALTSHIETDAYPLFSPDGQWVAFSSKRNGNWDIFAVPVAGGAARQLTWNAGPEYPNGWSPDGRKLLFTGRRDTPNYSIYSLEVSSLRVELLGEDFAPLYHPNYSPDGGKVVYGRYGFHWTRPRYHGSAAQQIWVLDTATQERHPLATNDWQHLWTRFLPDGKHVVTVTVGEDTPSSSSLQETIAPIIDNHSARPTSGASTSRAGANR